MIAVDRLDWRKIRSDLNTDGSAVLHGALSADECTEFIRCYECEDLFRSRVDMQRHNFGRGEYRYFSYPLPTGIEQLRVSLYAQLAPLANEWSAALKTESFPATHLQLIERCRNALQTRPTPLLLKYTEGDYNCLHQDLYGKVFFPMQVVILLSRPDTDFAGGELVLVEQRPRMQSRVHIVPLHCGDAAIIPSHHRPVKGMRGFYRVNVRHGVSRVQAGHRFALGIIFHDAA